MISITPRSKGHGLGDTPKLAEVVLYGAAGTKLQQYQDHLSPRGLHSPLVVGRDSVRVRAVNLHQ